MAKRGRPRKIELTEATIETQVDATVETQAVTVEEKSNPVGKKPAAVAKGEVSDAVLRRQHNTELARKQIIEGRKDIPYTHRPHLDKNFEYGWLSIKKASQGDTGPFEVVTKDTARLGDYPEVQGSPPDTIKAQIPIEINELRIKRDQDEANHRMQSNLERIKEAEQRLSREGTGQTKTMIGPFPNNPLAK